MEAKRHSPIQADHVKLADKGIRGLVSAVYEELKSSLCKHEVLHADETTLRVLRNRENGRSKCYMWLYRTSGEAKNQILYDYHRDRKAIHAEEFLKGFKGYLHTDGYEGYISYRRKLSGRPSCPLKTKVLCHENAA